MTAQPHDIAPQPAYRQPAISIAVASGKGGAGKTNISANLAVALAGRGRRVCIVDVDSGMANINVLLGLQPTYTIEDVVSGKCTLQEILLEGPRGVQIVPGASGIAVSDSWDPAQREQLISALHTLESSFDYLIIDTAAGGGAEVTRFLAAASQRIVVITPDPTSLTNAFSLLKIMQRNGDLLPVWTLINQAETFESSREIFQRFASAVRKHIKREVNYLGYIADDKTVVTAIRLQRPVVTLKHSAPASLCFYKLAEIVSGDRFKQSSGAQFAYNWEQLTSTPDAKITDHANPKDRALAAQIDPAEQHSNGDWEQEFTGLVEQLVDRVEQGPLTQESLEQFLQPLMRASMARFGRYPINLRKSLLRAINCQQSLSRAEFHYIAGTLRNAYRDNWGEPLPEDAAPPDPE